MELTVFELFKLKRLLYAAHDEELDIQKAIKVEYTGFVALAIETRRTLSDLPPLDHALPWMGNQLRDAETVITLLGKAKCESYGDWAIQIFPLVQKVNSSTVNEICETYDVETYDTPRYHSKFLKCKDDATRAEVCEMLKEYRINHGLIPPEYWEALKIFYQSEKLVNKLC